MCIRDSICATQVSLDMAEADWQKYIHALYEFEHLTPLLFSKPMTVSDSTKHCLRHLVIKDNWPNDPYVGYPRNIDNLIEAVKLIPPPRTAKYAYCAFRKPRRVEFRSCDRLDTAEEILSMVCFRWLVVEAVKRYGRSGTEAMYCQLFEAACADGSVDQAVVHAQRDKLESCWNSVQKSQSSWQVYAESLFAQLVRLEEGN